MTTLDSRRPDPEDSDASSDDEEGADHGDGLAARAWMAMGGGREARTVAEDERGCAALCEIAARGDLAECERLLASDEVKDVNWGEIRRGNTALHIAAEEGHAPVVRLLLERKADPNVANDYGHYPLSLCSTDTDIFRVLKAVTLVRDNRRDALNC